MRGLKFRASFSQLWPCFISLVLLACHASLAAGQEDLDEEGCEEEERDFDSEVRVATLQFSELQVEFLVVVFILIVVLAKLGRF